MADALERAARAIYCQAFIEYEGKDLAEEGWADVHPTRQQSYMNEARAALETLLEPDEAMVEAACSAVADFGVGMTDDEAMSVIREIVRAALQQEPGDG